MILFKNLCLLFFALHAATVLVKLASGNTLAFPYVVQKDFTSDASHMTKATL